MIWLVVGLILVSVLAVGTMLYATTKVVDQGNCAAVGGEMIRFENEWNCVDRDHIDRRIR